jgi:murein DD-endopeptidase MepM/ murein hydrolase activator NlpD|tara:strand:- start:423 stop:1286 length:864 start_codon:yes stop_codon:yes gene_type:complete
MSKKEHQKHFWRQRFRITIQEESTFHERRAYLLSGRRISSIVIGAVFSVSVISYAIIAYTPLTEFLVPGFIAKQFRDDVTMTRKQSDSALATLSIQEKYLSNLKLILSGEVPFEELEVVDSVLNSTEVVVIPEAGDVDIAFRSRIEEEDRFMLRRGKDVDGLIGFEFQPVKGFITSGFDLSHGHIGVDIEAEDGKLVHAVDDGTVLMSDFTVEHGYVLVIQHRNDRVSIYKHNSSLLMEVGDLVRMGDVVASVGNSGTQTSGPHLHFEWWVNGQPMDPAPWLNHGGR